MSSSWPQGYPPPQPPQPYPYSPQQQPYPPAQPYGYPPQGYQQYPPPPQQYPPPPPPGHNPKTPQRSRPPRNTEILRKAKPLHIAISTVVVLALCGGAMYLNDARPDPQVGACLVDMDYDFLVGMDVVDCGDPEATYEIVELTQSRDEAICSGHSNGESYQYSGGRKNRTKWSLCAVPLN